MRDQADELRLLVRQQVVDGSSSLNDLPDASDDHRRIRLRKNCCVCWKVEASARQPSR